MKIATLSLVASMTFLAANCAQAGRQDPHCRLWLDARSACTAAPAGDVVTNICRVHLIVDYDIWVGKWVLPVDPAHARIVWIIDPNSGGSFDRSSNKAIEFDSYGDDFEPYQYVDDDDGKVVSAAKAPSADQAAPTRIRTILKAAATPKGDDYQYVIRATGKDNSKLSCDPAISFPSFKPTSASSPPR
ncbi:MAG: hypothetical protein JSR59_09535 [Proteobacteria bacterium]|nr:hypothetical protein [Pseudomonadota bacterium]